ncbi:hypothetical protein CANINC_001725 [Pichia inconspicua]|uniref:AN1-type domain-containing protein n=1 Tax=Pichia inconspicua TaxID=52247 RepID=A0A4T0X477_9ASCO|nr:hypothetical protein CANINC_001725 [[Candida] inconspicua]
MTTIHEDEGMLDIGKHCRICRELDFLPFVCHKCRFTYCSKHRDDYNEHDCDGSKKKKPGDDKREKYDISKLPKASSVFPDLPKIRKEAEIKYQMEQGRKIGNRLTKVLNESDKPMTSIEVAMVRLKKLLKNSSDSMKKSNSVGKGSGGFFGFGVKSSSNTNSKSAKMIDMNSLRRNAKGDAKIAVIDRVYVWVSYNTDDEKSLTLREAQFFSKKWPIGKMLDSSAKLSKIRNLNNQEVDSSLKLAMFRKARDGEKINDSEEFVYIPTSSRVEKEIMNGDQIYILRGKQ